MLDEIAGYLVTNTIGTLTGTSRTIFINVVPDTPDLCIMLFYAGGGARELTHDGAGDIEYDVQIRVRGAKNGTSAAVAKMEAIATLLHGVSNTTIGSGTYRLIRATSGILSMGQDTAGRPEFSQHFTVIKG